MSRACLASSRNRHSPRSEGSRSRCAAVVAGLVVVGLTACSQPTTGPTIRVDNKGWTPDPPSIVQPGEWFTFTVVNSRDIDVEFVVLQMNYGNVDDLPVVDGVVDVTRQVVYESDDPTVQSPPVVAYYVVYPAVEGEGAVGWEPAKAAAGASATVQVGNRGLGGGEPGRFAVVSYHPGGLGAGEYAEFELTDENGQVPRFTLEDFFS